LHVDLAGGLAVQLDRSLTAQPGGQANGSALFAGGVNPKLGVAAICFSHKRNGIGVGVRGWEGNARDHSRRGRVEPEGRQRQTVGDERGSVQIGQDANRSVGCLDHAVAGVGSPLVGIRANGLADVFRANGLLHPIQPQQPLPDGRLIQVWRADRVALSVAKA